jgi:zinc transporter ZupT
MSWLVAAVAAPVFGPILYRLLHDHPRAVRLVDGSVYVAVPVLVAVQVLPHAWEERSLLVVAALVAGLLVPEGIERLSHVLERYTDDVALLVGLTGLVVHGLLEGGAFAPNDGSVDTLFALAVVLHRVPVGLVVWWLLRPRHGALAASIGIGLLMGSTLVGWVVGTEVLGGVHGVGMEVYQAFVSGTLVHVVFHQGRHDHTHDDDQGHHHHRS